MITAILFILMLLVLVIPHEWGHMIVAKLFGVQVNEFSMGMGPLLFSKQVGETKYSVRLLPLGGFCAMEGEEEASDNPRAYNNKTPLQQTCILLAGVTMNIIIAILVLGITFSITGIVTNRLDAVDPKMPAYEAGIRENDVITAVNGEKCAWWSDFTTAVGEYEEGDHIEVTVNRDGTERTFIVTPEYSKEEGRYLVGVQGTVSKDPVRCFAYGTRYSWVLTKAELQAFGMLITGQLKRDEVAGPIGLVKVVDQTRQIGATSYLMLLALVSLNLVIFNLIPIPGLDGGKIFFIILRKLSGGRITEEMEGRVTAGGFILLIALTILITMNDITNLFH